MQGFATTSALLYFETAGSQNCKMDLKYPLVPGSLLLPPQLLPFRGESGGAPGAGVEVTALRGHESLAANAQQAGLEWEPPMEKRREGRAQQGLLTLC